MANLKFKEAFEAVFDENGNVKLCGRETCKQLIKACTDLEPRTYFGNPITGQLNLKSYPRMKKLYDEQK